MKSQCMRCGDGTLIEQFRAELSAVTAERDALREKVSQVYSLATRALADPPDGTATLVEICTVLEGAPVAQNATTDRHSVKCGDPDYRCPGCEVTNGTGRAK